MSIKVNHVFHSYYKKTPNEVLALNDVSLNIEEGSFVALVGETGSGKSTLVQHLNALILPDSGSIEVDEFTIGPKKRKNKKLHDLRKHIGLIFQFPEYQLFEETVYKDIAFGPKNTGLNGDELDKRVKDTCKLLDIDLNYLEKSPFDLSGGEKRRVAIAGVMAMNPKVVVFDEPIAGLDPMGRKKVIKMIEQYRIANNATVLIISHNMEDMAQIADKLLVMNKGNLVKFDTTVNVFSDSGFLKDIGLNVPTVTEVFDRLKKNGIPINRPVLTIDDAVKVLCALKDGGKTYA